jgi:Tfp pilus assembly PilM family ATPase
MKTVALPPGLVNESYAAQNVEDMEYLGAVLKESLAGASAHLLKRAALSLPDGIFRVQMLEFDQLPNKPGEREKLIRWRLEKCAFETSDMVLRYRIVREQEKSVSVLVCAARKPVLAQYEAILLGLGLEPWSVAPSSFHALNFYQPYLSKSFPVFALAHVSEDTCTTIISETEDVRFYRFKDVKRREPDGLNTRLAREIADSVHFYRHRDRVQQTEIQRVYLTGEGAIKTGLLEGLKDMAGIEVEVLLPSIVLPSIPNADRALASVFGSGSCL